MNCPNCHSTKTICKSEVSSRPTGETDFKIPDDQYYRAISYCLDCEIYFCNHNYNFDELYKGNYNNSTYKDQLAKTYEKIMGLPPEKSDNNQRCNRIHSFLQSQNLDPSNISILDIGSGLSVFLGKMKDYGYSGFALDPDPESVKHAIEYVKLDGGYCGELESFSPKEPFQLITLNKVLEHVKNPNDLLNQALAHLEKNKYCYIELPDGEAASKSGGFIDREEFYIEHYFAYTKHSFISLMESCGLKVLKIEAVHEPSDKYTLYAFGQKTI